MVLGEGAGILVLESLDHARARGANILAELCGLATTADSTDMLSPDLDGASETMRLALEDAGLAPIEIDYVNAHGAATPAGDRVETHAIRRTFGAHAEKLAVSATKPMYGNPLGASGARILTTLLYALARRNARRGIAALCLGGGNGVAIAVERMASA